MLRDNIEYNSGNLVDFDVLIIEWTLSNMESGHASFKREFDSTYLTRICP